VPVEDVTPETLRPVRPSQLVQRRHDLAFLHWAVPPETVAPFLPAGNVVGGRTAVAGADRARVAAAGVKWARMRMVKERDVVR
jgi:hypothetical protein